MALKKKSALKESFSQGLGSELGKKTAGVIIAIIVVIALFIWGAMTNDSSQEPQTSIEKDPGRNGAVE